MLFLLPICFPPIAAFKFLNDGYAIKSLNDGYTLNVLVIIMLRILNVAVHCSLACSYGIKNVEVCESIAYSCLHQL